MKSNTHNYHGPLSTLGEVEHEVNFPDMQVRTHRKATGEYEVHTLYTDPASGRTAKAVIKYPELFHKKVKP